MINDDTIYNNSSSSNNKQEQTVLNISTTTTSNDSTKPSTLTTDELESAKILQHFSLAFVNATVPLTSSSAAPATALTTAAATNTVREGTGKAQDEEESSKALEEVSVTASSPSSSSSHQFLVNESTSKTNNEMIGLDNTSYNAIAYNNTTAMPINANSSSSVLATVTIGNAANDNNVGANGVVDKKRQRDCDSDPESDDENDDDEDEDDDGESGNKKGNSKKRVRHPVYPLWTVEEDELLMQKNIECGNDWAKISTFLTGRSRVDVKVRYKSIVSAEKKLWNIKDDERIFQLHKIHNADWKTISSHFSGRTKNAVRVRYKELKRLAFQPIKAPSLGSAKQIFYKRCHPHFHRNSTVIGSSDAANEQQEVQQQQKAMPAPQMEKSKKESLASTSKASSSSIFNDDAKKETEAKNNAAASSSSLFDTSIVIDDAMKISPQITQKEVNSRILTSIVHSSPQVRFPGPRPTIFCAPTPAAMNLPMHFPTMVNCYPTPGWPTQPTLTAIPTMFQQMPTNTTNGIPLMYSLFPQMPQFQQAPPKGI